MRYQAKDLFQLQHELVEMKVNMAVSNAIDRVVEQITNLRYEMHTDFSSLKNEMNKRFSSLDNRVIAIETKMGMVNSKRKGWYERFVDHIFKAGWAWLSIIFAYLIIHIK